MKPESQDWLRRFNRTIFAVALTGAVACQDPPAVEVESEDAIVARCTAMATALANSKPAPEPPEHRETTDLCTSAADHASVEAYIDAVIAETGVDGLEVE